MENNNFDDEKKTILIVDDEQKIVDLLVHNLTREGYNTIEANDGQTAIDLAISQRPDLILLDVMIPRVDGLTVCKKIKNYYNVPILMVSAKDDELDKIVGLEIGADDYITKPFNPLELIARVNSQIRRYTHLGSIADKQKEGNTYYSGDLLINDDMKQVTVEGKEIKLTPTEYNILKFLTKNKGIVYSIEQIYKNVWEDECYGAENIIAVHIRHIREKIEINPKEPKYLKVIWGIGYKIENLDK